MADARLAAQLVRMRQRRTGPLILELDLTDGIAEGPPADPLSALLTMRRTRLQDLLDGLRRAADDDRVRVLVVKVGGSRIGLAKIQELRAAIGDFRRSGKLTVAWADDQVIEAVEVEGLLLGAGRPGREPRTGGGQGREGPSDPRTAREAHSSSLHSGHGCTTASGQ